jgi:hypothetical protein
MQRNSPSEENTLTKSPSSMSLSLLFNAPENIHGCLRDKDFSLPRNSIALFGFVISWFLLFVFYASMSLAKVRILCEFEAF